MRDKLIIISARKFIFMAFCCALLAPQFLHAEPSSDQPPTSGSKSSAEAKKEDAEPTNQNAPEHKTFGWVEKIKIFPDELMLHAKLVPGSDGSSLHATEIERFKKGKEKFVRFKLTDRSGKEITLEKKLISYSSLKTRSKSGKKIKRPIIKLGICLGSVYLEEELNLSDRSSYSAEASLGRSFLAGNAVIDPSLSYTMEPTCEPPVEKEGKK